MLLAYVTATIGSMLLVKAVFRLETPRGLDFVHLNSPTPQKYLIETMGGGVAVLDYNNDGLPDLFFVNSGELVNHMETPEKFARHEPKYWNRLYRQNHDGSFTDVTKAAGLSAAGDGNYGMGVAVADYDNDGYPDIFVTSYGSNVLYHNNGDGTFTDVTAKAGVAGGVLRPPAFLTMTTMAAWISSLPAIWSGIPGRARFVTGNIEPTVLP